ncbi:zinc finger BED domain-containing protein DAYSLEEPER [Trifolium repens]|nr:zinc finger BED domain-containing protein DAYSLEEPER [Trifolium repens]
MNDVRKTITHLVLNNEHAFKIVGSEGFRKWCKLLQPQFIVPSQRTIAKDCYALYLSEKLKLKTFLKTDCNWIALTRACWTSMQNLSYLVIVAYSIDNDRKYHKRIICFTLISNKKEDTIESKVEKVLTGWGISNVSIVASESEFSMEGRFLDTYRNSSSPRMAEVLICTQSWLKPSLVDIKDLKLVETLFQNMTIEAGTCGASGSSAAGGAPPAAGRTI